MAALFAALAAVAIILSTPTYSQNPTAVVGQFYGGRARLFIADNSPASPAIAVVDLPSYNYTQRIPLPGTTAQLGVTNNEAHLGVFRNRDNRHQFFSVISTGILPAVPAAGSRALAPAVQLKAGQMGIMGPAFLAKSIIMVNGTDAIGGVKDGGRLVFHEGWKLYLMYAENHGRIFTYRLDNMDGVADFKPSAAWTLPVGHFHILPYGNFLIAPHTGQSKAYIMDNRGRVVREYVCGGCHGAEAYVTNQLSTAVFGCNTSVLVVRNTSANGTHVRVAGGRVSSFVPGVPGVFWASNSTQRFFWRTDVLRAVPQVTNVTHRGGIIRMISLRAHGRIAALHNDGNLVMYDGDSGAELASVRLREGGFPANQTAPFLQSDSQDEHVFVAVPALGVVHVVDVEHGGHDDHAHAPGEHVDDEPQPATMVLTRTMNVGGVPTNMALAYMPGVAAY